MVDKTEGCGLRGETESPWGTRRFSYSSQAAYTHLTAQLALRAQTGAPSDAASLLVPTENQLTSPEGFLSLPGDLHF